MSGRDASHRRASPAFARRHAPEKKLFSETESSQRRSHWKPRSQSFCGDRAAQQHLRDLAVAAPGKTIWLGPYRRRRATAAGPAWPTLAFVDLRARRRLQPGDVMLGHTSALAGGLGMWARTARLEPSMLDI